MGSGKKAGLFLHLLFGINRFYFLEQFHIFGKSEQKAQRVLCNLVSPVHTTFSITNIPRSCLCLLQYMDQY